MKKTTKEKPDAIAIQLPPAEPTPATLLQMAITKGVDIAQLEKLMDLQERWEKGEARKKFFAALAEFQSRVPIITKNKEAGFEGRTGGSVKYSYATLGQIISQIQEPLRDCGLSYRWEIVETESHIIVKCLVTHKDGHTEATQMGGKADTTGAKNEIQSRGSTITYLRRYTLTGVLGIGTAEEDNDGKAGKPIEQPVKGIAAEMQKEIDAVGTVEELGKYWNERKGMQGNMYFATAIKKRKAELVKKEEGTNAS